MIHTKFFTLILLLIIGSSGLTNSVFLSDPTLAVAASGDMVSAVALPGRCLTADGNLSSGGAIARMITCSGLDTQYWQIDAENKWHVQADLNYCLALDSDDVWYNKLMVLPCTDSRARGFVAETQADNTVMFLITNTTNGTVFALDTNEGVLAENDYQVWLYNKDNVTDYQRWRWFQTDLNVAQASGCNIGYPLVLTDTVAYQRERACDQVANVQPPYVVPANVVRDPAVFPGAVGPNAASVTQTFHFSRVFKNHAYLRFNVSPANWLNTGLYAAPNQIVRVTVANTTTAELQNAWVQVGVHTDQLHPTSGNVVEKGSFLRYPNVITRVPLQVGETLVRSPYGGPIVLVSARSVTTTLQVTIDGAVQEPYLKVGVTTPAEWLERRSAPVPYGSLESELAVVYMPASELSQLSYEEALAVAQSYSTFGVLHNQLAGLSATDMVIHQPPQGQYWHVADIQISNGWGHNGFPAMYNNAWNLGTPSFTIAPNDTETNWGLYHELGHNYQMDGWSNVYGTEVTTNLFSLYAQEKLFGTSRLVKEDTYAKAIKILDDPAVVDKWNNDGKPDPLIQLVFLEQIRLGFPTLNWQIWTQLMRRYREMPQNEYDALNTDTLKRDRFMTLLCEITNTNLTPHFDAWTIATSTEAKNICATYSPLTREIWRIDGAQMQPIQAYGAYLPLIHR